MTQVIAVAALCAISAGTALAQSSLTLTGTLDANLRSVQNGDTRVRQVASNGTAPSNIALIGQEDLGDGMQAGFWLESALFPDTGTADAARFWGRRATVSLVGRFGEIRLGRDQDPSYRNIAVFEPFGNLGVASGLPLVSTLDSGAQTLVRSDNLVTYFLPPILAKNCTRPYRECGLYGHFSVAPGEGIAGTKYRGGKIGYADGGFDLAIGLGATKTATTDDFKVANIGIAYDFKTVRLMGLYNQTQWGTRKQTIAGIGATALVTPLLMLRATFQRVDASGAGTDADDARLLGIGAVYYLSRRTSVYASAGQITNEGAAAYSVSTPPAAALAKGAKSTGYELGIRHSF